MPFGDNAAQADAATAQCRIDQPVGQRVEPTCLAALMSGHETALLLPSYCPVIARLLNDVAGQSIVQLALAFGFTMIHQPRSDRHHAATSALLSWYETHGRVLPWRAPVGSHADPYAVWLSEIMLQQTTVATVKTYFDAFISRWPDVRALAAAPRDDVLAAWAGLGYYARARNLHAAAITVAEQHDGHFPDTEAGLLALPGIGPYTAAAIAAIAFGRRAVVVDGNIERVTARWQAVETPLPKAKPTLHAVMDALTPDDRAGDFAQAMMDLGAMVCTPPRRQKSGAGLTPPDCARCPLYATCLGRKGEAAALPRKQPKKPQPQRHGVVLVLQDGGGRVLLEERPDQGLLGGMLVFPGSDWADGSPARQDYPLHDALPVAAVLPQASVPQRRNAGVQHVFTHFRLHLAIEEAVLDGQVLLPPRYRWVARDQLAGLALPTVMRKVAKAAGLI